MTTVTKMPEITHGNYTIKSYRNPIGSKEGPPEHIKGSLKHLDHLGIVADADKGGGHYGTTHRVTVKNNTTGDLTSHNVYQSDRAYDGSPVMSVRPVSGPNPKHDEHQDVLKKFLSGKSAVSEDIDSTTYVMEKYLAAIAGNADFTDTQVELKRWQNNGIKEESQLDEAKDHASMSDAELKKHISIHTRNALAHNLSKAASDNLRAAQAELKKRRQKRVAEESQLDELSTDLLARYKKAASKDATATDQRGDFERGNKRFSGIIKATKKQFANDLKVKEEVESFELDEENLHRVIGQVYSDDDQKWYRQSYTTRAKSKEHAVQKAKEQFGKRGQKFRNVEHDAEMHESVELDEAISQSAKDSLQSRAVSGRTRVNQSKTDIDTMPKNIGLGNRGKKNVEHGFRSALKRDYKKADLGEAMMSYSDFRNKIDTHRKMGNKIVDDKYTDKKATYTSISPEGIGKKITHTPSGTKQEHLGNMKGDDDQAEVKPVEKRGRGRPVGSKSGARSY